MTKIITFVIENGNIVLDLGGYSGKECEVDAQKILEIIEAEGFELEGGEIQHKPEYDEKKILRSQEEKIGQG